MAIIFVSLFVLILAFGVGVLIALWITGVE